MPPQEATPGFRVTGVSHVAIEVADIDASLRFYRDVLGMVVLFDGRFQPEQPGVKGLLGHFAIELAPAPGDRMPDRGIGPCLSFTVDDIDACLDALRRGGHADLPAPTESHGARFVPLCDPDGNALELIHFPGNAPDLGTYLATFFDRTPANA